jgi:hypothetical protein
MAGIPVQRRAIMSELTPKQKRDHERLVYALKEHEDFMLWRKMALEVLMTHLAPRVYALGQTFYTGCGFHYHLQKRVGVLIRNLAVVPKPCMNWLDKWYDETMLDIMLDELLFEEICESVIRGEETAAEWEKRGDYFG